jgi:hypothetical protein
MEVKKIVGHVLHARCQNREEILEVTSLVVV